MDVETFDIDMQQKILSVMVQDRLFLAQSVELVKPAYFDSEVLVDLVRLTEEYFREFNDAPTPLALAQLTKDYLKTVKRKNPVKYFDMIEDVFADSLPEKDFIAKQVREFVKAHEVRNALAECADLWQDRKYDKMQAILQKAFSVTEFKREVYRYFDEKNVRERYAPDTDIRIPTGFPDFDNKIGGGLGPGELGVILAPTNVGKSIWLTLFGANALRLRKKVLHITLEMSKKKVALRYDRNLTGKTKAILQTGSEELAKSLVTLQNAYHCDLVIEKFPTKGLSVAELRAYLAFLKLENFVPELLLVDYASIMKPSSRQDKHIQIEEIVEDLRGLGDELGIPIWTAAQTKQSAVNKKHVSIEDLGEAYAQAKIADVIAALCQTKSEAEEDLTRLFLAKNRDDKKYQTLLYSTIYDIMRVKFLEEVTGADFDKDEKKDGKKK